MNNRYSIHDTHRVPYINAVLTAKQLSSSTTPVKFRTFDGTVIGLSVKTNARGYCCQSDGTPYVDGVFVGEDAIITATLSDGSSTSWTVGSESEITVFDGKLYGKEITNTAEYSDTDVVIGGTHYKRLFSANQKTDVQLSLEDLANVPSFTKWTEDQQIERFDVGGIGKSTDVYIHKQTKVLILINSNKDFKVQTYPQSFTVNLFPTLDEEHKTRFGRNLSVFNLTGMPIHLKNGSGLKGSIAVVNTATAIEVAETYPSAPEGSYIGGEVQFVAVDNAELASNGGVVYEIPNNANASSSYLDYIVLGDATPAILNIASVANKSDGTTKPVLVKYEGSAGTFRRIVIRRFDDYATSIALITESGAVLGLVPPNGSIEITVSKSAESETNESVVDNTLPWVREQTVTLIPNGNAYVKACLGHITLDATAVTSSYTGYISNLIISEGVDESYRIDIVGNTVPCWVRLQSDLGIDGDLFCVPVGGGTVVVHNVYGIGTVVFKTWNDTAPHSTYDNNIWTSSFTTFDAKADLAYLYAQTSEAFAFNRGQHHQDYKMAFPLKAGQTARIRVRMPFYSSVIESGNADSTLYVADQDGHSTNISSIVLFKDAKMSDDCFIAGGWTLEGRLTRSLDGASVSFELIGVTEYKE